MTQSEHDAPWLWPYGAGSQFIAPEFAREGWVSARLNAAAGATGAVDMPRFSHSEESLGALAYEQRVAQGAVPTRDVSHDWYNGLVWLAFPHAKRWINAQHLNDAGSRESSALKPGNGRSRFRDALTLFDESGALLLTNSEEKAFALLAHNWDRVFEPRNVGWHAQSRLLIFGHGLLDAMGSAHPGLCAKALPVVVPDLNFSAMQLQEIVLGVLGQIREPSDFSPLPVMGIPVWFDQSGEPGFYDNPQVFRAKPTGRRGLRGERLAFQVDATTLAVGKCVRQSLPVLQGEESPDSSEQSAG